MTQTIDISSLVQQNDARPLTYQLSAWLGGYSSQDDNASILVQFLGTSSNVLGSAKLGPVMATDPNDTTELLQRHSNGTVPAGTRTITVTLTMVKTDGSDNDGLADDISLIMQPVSTITPTVTP